MINNIKPANPTDSLAVDANSLNSLRSAATQNSPEAIKGASKQFEALFLNMMLKSMRDATPQDGMLDSQQTKMFTGMLDQQLSQNMAQRAVSKPLPTDEDNKSSSDAVIPLLRGMSDIDKAKLFQGIAESTADLPAPDNPSNKRRGAQSRPAHVEAFQNRLQADADRASQMTGIPAKFMLAQAALETGWGKKEIRARDGSSAHNLFGIKAGGNWTGKVVEASTIEYVNGIPQKRIEKFRAYESYAEAFRDYANILRSNPRYEKVLANAQDAHGFAYGLQRAGYATDPHYAEKLSRIINQSLSA